MSSFFSYAAVLPTEMKELILFVILTSAIKDCRTSQARERNSRSEAEGDPDLR